MFEQALSKIFPLAIQVTRPVPIPCFGVLKKEKHVLLPSVADVVIEQGDKNLSTLTVFDKGFILNFFCNFIFCIVL